MPVGRPGNFRALVGTSTQSPLSRFDGGGPPWSRVDGVLIADQAIDLWNNLDLIAPINATAGPPHNTATTKKPPAIAAAASPSPSRT